MAASRLPPAALTLKQFLRRQQVLQLYRRILQAIRQVPTETDRHYLKEWAREEFKRNKDATDERKTLLDSLRVTVEVFAGKVRFSWQLLRRCGEVDVGKQKKEGVT
ncbi:hypothetical protein KIL84_016507 [Mauremys mutica]|uniref:LYR motif-containing protein 2 n=1 Tax=Mauremys mutica TaxID=74926 RepID=A0A9D3X4M5_9SAUR|nr:hypothetical protein KIL84_016507 [Mauremys mutica]